MKFLGYAYRFVSNFVFLALVYFSLNFMEKYQQRAILAILVLVYAAMRAASALRSFYFFQRIGRAQANRQRGRGAASGRRDEVLYRPVVSRPDRPAMRSQDRDGLSRHTFRFLTWTRCFSRSRRGCAAIRGCAAPAAFAAIRDPRPAA